MNEFPIKLALNASDTLAETIDCLTQHISLDTQGACDAKSLFQILVRAASKGDTIEQTAKELKQTPSSNNIRYHLSKIRDFVTLEKELNIALRSQIPQGLKKKKQALAIDINFGQKGIEYLVYVVHKVNTNLGYVRQNYRQRFGIETSYRLKNLARVRTTTKKPTLRLLFVGLSFLLVNIWINLLWRRISQPRRGGRLIYREKFPFKQMLSFLCQAVDQIFQVVDAIYIPLAPTSISLAEIT